MIWIHPPISASSIRNQLKVIQGERLTALGSKVYIRERINNIINTMIYINSQDSGLTSASLIIMHESKWFYWPVFNLLELIAAPAVFAGYPHRSSTIPS